MRIIVPDPLGNYLVGFAKKKLKSCIALRKDLDEIVVERIYDESGFRITVHAEEDNDFILITGGTFSGFLFHPRTFNGKGWNTKGEELPYGPFDYPLIDGDHGTRGLKWKNGSWEYVNSPPENYGNIDWIGFNTAASGKPSNAPILTWKGPQGRTVSHDYRTEITGLTTYDVSFDGSDYFTPFGPNIYSGGKVKSTLPTVGDCEPKVLGCAIQGKYLVAVVSNYYASRSGFYDEIWVATSGGANWQKIHEIASGRPTMCWFFNQSGTRATQGLCEYAIDCEEEAVTRTCLENNPSVLTISKVVTNPTRYDLTHTGEWRVYSDYKGDTRVFVTTRITGGASTVGEVTESSTSGDMPVYITGEEVIVDLYIDGPEDVTVGERYTYGGGVISGCPQTIEWTMSGGTISQAGTVLTITGCGMGSITVTMQPSGLTATLPVRLPDGVWVLQSTEGSGGTANQTSISGGTKITEYYTCGCGLLPHYTEIIYWNPSTGICGPFNAVTSYSLYDPAQMHPIGASQLVGIDLDAICLALASPCVLPPYTITHYYTACDEFGMPIEPIGSSGSYDTVYEVGDEKAIILRRLTYTWECP